MSTRSKSIIHRVKKYNLPLGEYAVFGSALMDLWGIRTAKDLDIIVTPELFEKLKKNDEWEMVQANGFFILRSGEADLTTVQDRPTDGDYFPDRNELINEAVIVDGVPFVRIEEVIKCKTSYNRKKDIEDIAAINRFLNSNRSKIY